MSKATPAWPVKLSHDARQLCSLAGIVDCCWYSYGLVFLNGEIPQSARGTFCSKALSKLSHQLGRTLTCSGSTAMRHTSGRMYTSTVTKRSADSSAYSAYEWCSRSSRPLRLRMTNSASCARSPSVARWPASLRRRPCVQTP